MIFIEKPLCLVLYHAHRLVRIRERNNAYMCIPTQELYGQCIYDQPKLYVFLSVLKQ